MRAIVLTPLLALTLLACEKEPAVLAVEPATLLPFVTKGKSVKLKAQTKDDKGVFIATVQPKWESSAPLVASVDAEGNVTSVGSGKAVITGTHGKVKAEIPVEVKLVGTVEIEPKEPQKLRMGKSMKVKVTVKDDHGNVLADEKVLYRTSGHAIDVEPDGTVIGQAIGDSVLIARAQDKETRLQFAVDE